MTAIDRISHATFETTDVEKMADYYCTIMGLTRAATERDRVHLSCRGETHSVTLTSGTRPRCTDVAFLAKGPEALGAMERTLTEAGRSFSRQSDPAPDVSQALAIEGPEGISVSVYCGTEKPAKVGADSGIAPLKLGHVAFNVSDPQKATDFFVDLLGFRVSDWMGDFFAFLRCGPDHHTINLLRGQRTKMHHIAFAARDWGHIKSACDFLGAREMPLIWGPGRHGVGHNIFIYHYNPDGQIVELYCEMDQMSDESLGYFDPQPWHEDKPQRPKVWTPGPHVSNIWGIPTPNAFRD